MLYHSFCNPAVPSAALGTQQAHNKYLLSFIEPAHRLLTLMFEADPCLKYSAEWLCLPFQKTKKLKRATKSHGLPCPTLPLLSLLLPEIWILKAPGTESVHAMGLPYPTREWKASGHFPSPRSCAECTHSVVSDPV